MHLSLTIALMIPFNGQKLPRKGVELILYPSQLAYQPCSCYISVGSSPQHTHTVPRWVQQLACRKFCLVQNVLPAPPSYPPSSELPVWWQWGEVGDHRKPPTSCAELLSSHFGTSHCWCYFKCGWPIWLLTRGPGISHLIRTVVSNDQV